MWMVLVVICMLDYNAKSINQSCMD
uniref:Uncharacterized protein n=1 Tax=Rhizophora mucronata TaxID=61149 RepID=A0A2P2Q6J0_RHIMU